MDAEQGESRSQRRVWAALIVAGCVLLLFVAAELQLRVVLNLPPDQVRASHFVVPLSIGAVFGVLLAVIRELSVRDRRLRAALGERERSLAEANLRLERRVAERTRDLEAAHAQLLHTQRLDAVGQVAGGVAHDFNNMLMVVLGCIDALEATGLPDPTARAAVAEARGACDRARQITRQLLIFSRKDAVQVAPQRVQALLDGILPLMQRLAGSQVAVQVELEGPAPLGILCDRGQLEQVLVNLVVNARDAGARHVRILGAAAGAWVRLSLVDDGTGMSAETLRRAVEPFFTTKAAGRGTGLGLSVAHDVVRGLGGAIEIESAEGKGTTVHLLLPSAELPSSAETTAGTAAGERPAKRVILLVEDEPSVRRTVVRLLQTAGYEVIEADSIASGERALEQHGARLDAMLTDLRLPDGSGTALIRAVATHHPKVPVLAMTGYVEDAERNQLGAATLLAKPFATKELLERLRAMTRDPKAATPAA